MPRSSRTQFHGLSPELQDLWAQEDGGFPLLVQLLDTSAGRHATIAPAVATLTQLARNNARNR